MNFEERSMRTLRDNGKSGGTPESLNKIQIILGKKDGRVPIS
jgi:hypothetical protein